MEEDDAETMDWFWWTLIAALIWGFAPAIEKAGLTGAHPLAGLFYRCVGVMAGMLAIPLIIGFGRIRQVDARSAVLLVFGGFLASFLAQVAYYAALKTGEVSRVVPLSGSYQLVAFLVGVLAFSEGVTPMKLAGMALILGGIWAMRAG